MLNLFNRNKILLDEDIIEWIFKCYAWTFEQFDKDVFDNETCLVIPDNKHFPGKETSAEGMANLIFKQVKSYAGMSHWPTHLFDLESTQGQVPGDQPVQISGGLRGKKALHALVEKDATQSAMPQSSFPQNDLTDNKIAFTYHPQQLKSPEGVIAHFAHGLAYRLASTATTPPPGGTDYVPMATELTGIFMGFGLMFANSAVVQRGGGCGSCAAPGPVRQVFLNEEEVTYALAVFCHLKGIESNQVTRHLKKHLRGFFKSALKDCQRRIDNDSDKTKLLKTG